MKQSVSDIVKEVQEYERLREVREHCGQTTVQAVNCLVLNGGLHSGTVVHKCTLRKEQAEGVPVRGVWALVVEPVKPCPHCGLLFVGLKNHMNACPKRPR